MQRVELAGDTLRRCHQHRSATRRQCTKTLRFDQAAVDAAKNGDTIQVAGGNYRENVEVKGKGLTLLGGFAPDFASRDAATNVSTINGIGGNAVVALLDARQTTIEGFRITNGTGNELQRQYFILGGGIYGRGGTLTIRGNLIEQNNIIATHNNRENVGGGAFFESATVNFVSNVVRNNTGGRGAAIGTQDGDRVLIEGNLVLDNTAVGDHGGGIYVAGPNIEIVGNYISGNKVTFREGTWGGGVLVYNKGSKAQLRYNTITKNHATLIGSGVFIDDGAQVTLQNELIFGNVCPETGGAGLYVDGLTKSLGSRATVLFSTIAGHNCPSGKGQAVFLEAGSQVEIKNSILWGNGGDDLYADGSSSISAAFTISQEKFSGTQQTDPLFVDPKSDFHLRSRAGHFAANGNWVVDAEHSPAIDAADPTAPVGSETSPHGNRANLGAYGTTREASRSQSSAATPR